MLLLQSNFLKTLDYKQFQNIWPELFQLFEQNPNIYPPSPEIGLTTHWKRHNNFTHSPIYGQRDEVIGSENCYFILPCKENGAPVEPKTILLKEWRDIRQFIHPTPH